MEPNKLTIILKRPYITSEETQLKKMRLEDKSIYQIAEILLFDHPEYVNQNIVWMHVDDEIKLFGKDDASPHFLQIANHIYQVGIRNVFPGSISVSRLQSYEIQNFITYSKNGNESVMISPYLASCNFDLKWVSFKIEFMRFFCKETVFNLHELQERCKKSLNGRVINFNQTFTLETNQGTLLMKVENIELIQNIFGKLHVNFGTLANNTDIDFEINDSKIKAILYQAQYDPLSYCGFNVTLNKDLSFLPLKNNDSVLIHFDKFIKEIHSSLANQSLYNGFQTNIYFEGKFFTLFLKEVKNFKMMVTLPNYKRGGFLNSQTQINFITEQNEIIFVKEKPFVAKECSFKVIQILKTSENHLFHYVDVEELKTLLLEKQELAIGQYFKIDLKTGSYVIQLETAEKYFGEKRKISSGGFKSIWNFNKNCSFNFCAGNHLNLNFIEGKVIPKKNIIEELKVLGLGGIKDQLDILIRRVMVFHDPEFKDDIKKYDLKPMKGVIFHGSRGMGKRTLARHFFKQFGCLSENIRFIKGGEILKNPTNEIGNIVRNLFQDAIFAQNKYGDKSPLFVIAFEEFDVMAPDRSITMNKYSSSMVNEFLSVLDDLTDLNNILVIGITNHFENLDEAIKKACHFECQLEFGLPDYFGRLEILEIHTRDLLKNKRLAKDVNLKTVSNKVQGFTGADIKRLVRIACTYTLSRLREANNLEKQVREVLAEVTQNDFYNAIAEMVKGRKDNTEPPFGMYG